MRTIGTDPSIPIPEGCVYLLDKPRGLTSRRASSSVGRTWGYRRSGHAGTLDPAATGLLPVMLGRATRLSRFITAQPKTYEFTLRLGTTTDSGDETGEIIETVDDARASESMLLEALEHFEGSFEQRIPVFSAVRVGGSRAYKAARRGESPEMPVRQAWATDWELLERAADGSSYRLFVKVGTGTYVRALARDIGSRLGTGAHASDIRRVSVGSMSVDSASQRFDDEAAIVSMADAIGVYPRQTLDDDQLRDIRHGRPVDGDIEGTVALMDPSGELAAVGSGDGSSVRPVCVLRGL